MSSADLKFKSMPDGHSRLREFCYCKILPHRAVIIDRKEDFKYLRFCGNSFPQPFRIFFNLLFLRSQITFFIFPIIAGYAPVACQTIIHFMPLWAVFHRIRAHNLFCFLQIKRFVFCKIISWNLLELWSGLIKILISF